MEQLLGLAVFTWIAYMIIIYLGKSIFGISENEERNLSRWFLKTLLSPFKYGVGELGGMYQKEGFVSYFQKNTLIAKKYKGLLIDSQNDLRLSEDLSYQNCLIHATTGMGKTTKLLVPMILDLAKNNKYNSQVILDPKMEIYQLTSGYLSKQGYKIIVLNPQDLNSSIGFNPLAFVKSDADIESIMRNLLYSSSNSTNRGDSRFWDESSIHLLSIITKLLFSMRDATYVNLPNVRYLIQHFDSTPDNELDELFIKYGDSDLIREYIRLKSYEDSVILSIIATANMALSSIATNNSLQRILASDSFDFNQMRKEQIALYIQIPVQMASTYNFLVSSFINSMMQACLLKELPSKDDLGIYFLLDESGNFKIDLHRFITVSRGYKLSFTLVIQSTQQIYNLYGKDAAEVILNGGIGTKIFFGNASNDLTNSISNMIGKKRVLVQGKATLEPVLQSSEIRTLKSDQVLVFIQNNKPFIQKVQPYYTQPKFNKLTKIPPYHATKKQLVDYVDYLPMRSL